MATENIVIQFFPQRATYFQQFVTLNLNSKNGSQLSNFKVQGKVSVCIFYDYDLNINFRWKSEILFFFSFFYLGKQLFCRVFFKYETFFFFTVRFLFIEILKLWYCICYIILKWLSSASKLVYNSHQIWQNDDLHFFFNIQYQTSQWLIKIPFIIFWIKKWKISKNHTMFDAIRSVFPLSFINVKIHL